MFSEKEKRLREAICQVARMMYDREMLGGPAGNISARLDEETILLTPSKPFKQMLQPDEIIRINMQGQKVGPHTFANRDMRPTSEVPMHMAVYRSRPDVGGCVHGHPRHCIALTAAGRTIRPHVMTESVLFLGNIGTADYATPTTQELGDNVEQVVAQCDCVLLPYHGAIVAGRDVFDACSKLEVLELCAQINTTIASFGEEKPLANEHIEDILRLRQEMGMARESDSQLLED